MDAMSASPNEFSPTDLRPKKTPNRKIMAVINALKREGEKPKNRKYRLKTEMLMHTERRLFRKNDSVL